MAEKKFDAQVNYGWGLSLNMTGKAPAVAKRIFNTLADAQAYADNVKDSAIEGLVLSVVADGDKNGVYFVQSIKAEGSTESAVLVKLGTEAGASGNLSAAIKDLKVTDTAVDGQFVSEVSQTDGKISVNRASLADAKVGEDSAGHAISLTNKLTALNQSIIAEKEAREKAVTDIKGTLGEGDATTLGAINDELDAIDAKIGTVTENKTVVQMIADAETAAKAAATKMKLATSEAFLTLESTTDSSGATTYALGTKDLASDAELQTEKERALAAEGKLQTQIGTGFTSGNTVAAAIDNVKHTIDELNADVTSKEGTKVRVQVVETAGKITNVTVAESDIASASALTAETTARTAADTALDNRLTKIEGDEQTVGSIKKAVADAKKAIEGTFKKGDVQTLAELNTKIETVSSAAKTYSIAKATKSEAASLGTNVKEAYKLIENNKDQVGEFIPVYKDSSLKSVALDGQILKFTYILADGSEDTVGVDVSTFLAESEFANGLQVVNHIVSVKRDATSEGFLTVGADGIKLSGVQSAIDTAKKAVTDRLDKIEGEEDVVGSIKKAIKDAKDYTDAEIIALNATAGTQNVSEGKHVAVEVVETAGKLTSLVVTENDIASASDLTSEISRANAAEKENADAITILNGDATKAGSVAKAVKDAKDALLDNATSDYNTLGKLEGKIKDAEAAAKAAATKLVQDNEGHVTVSGVQDQTTSAWTYTISENDIASANALTAEAQTRASEDTAIKGRLSALEGVTINGENAIDVSASGATESKVVSLKLGAQPAEGVAGVVLSQDANGLVAKLYWGTF